MANNFDVNEFRSSIDQSYHRTAHFDMNIGMPNGLRAGENRQNLTETARKLHFDIEATNLPGVAIGTDENRRFGIGPFSLKPYAPIFDTINVVVRSDSKGNTYEFFQNWMQSIINYDFSGGIDGTRNNKAVYDVSYKIDYISMVEINMYDEAGGDPTVKLFLIDAFPIHMGNVALDWHDNNIVRIPLTFTFANWYLSPKAGSTGAGVQQPSPAVLQPTRTQGADR